ncbi:MAG TPA: glycine--tRNA ligase subunit beta, partial [Candidatus Paceibacterota bacterium]
MKKIPTATQPKARLSHAAELLFEIGVEELPYQFIAPALSSLEDHAGRLFQEARLSYGSIKAYGTPRRLALVVQALAIHQTAVTKETMGPSKSVAF